MTSTITPAKQRVQKAASFLLALYSFLFFLMHFIRIFDNSFWGDEGFTIRLAKMGFVDMVSATAKDVHPPLYYFFTQILCHIFGFHGYTYHLTAVIPYGLILVLCCTVVRKWFGALPAAVVVTLSSLTDAALIYNVEARMYSLAALFVFTAYLAFYQIYQKNRLMDWFIFGFASLCAAYTHYYALISVAFFYLMLLPLLRRGKKYLKRIAFTYLSAVIIYLPWLFILLNSFKSTAASWWLTAPPSAKETLYFLFGHSWIFLVFILAIAGFFLYRLGIIRSQAQPEADIVYRYDLTNHLNFYELLSTESLWILAGLLSFVGTIGVGWILTKAIRPFFLTRYIYQLSAVVYLMLGFCISKFQLRRFITAIFLILVFLVELPIYKDSYRSERQTEAGTSAFLEAVQPSQNTLLYTNNYYLDWTLFEYYYPNNPHALTSDYDISRVVSTSPSEVWLFWQKPLRDDDISQVESFGYSTEYIYEGALADSTHYYVYKLLKDSGEALS